LSRTTNTFTPVAIHGVPRSGTTWIGEIINSSPNTLYHYQPLFSYAHKDYLTPKSTQGDIDTFFTRLKSCNDNFTGQLEQRHKGILPVFQKEQITHIAYKEVRYHNILANLMAQKHDLKLVTIIRNPLSVINSWLKAPKEFRADLNWNMLNEWQYATKKNQNKPEEYNGFEKWKEASTLFLDLKEAYPDRVHLITYSAYLADPIQETKLLFNFLDLSYTGQTIRFLNESTGQYNVDPYSVYKTQQSDDAWKQELPNEISEKIQSNLKDTRLEIFLT
jgi:hypothetical protein